MKKLIIITFFVVIAFSYTDCTMHPCFEFTYIPSGNGEKEGVYSGDFKGSDYNISIDELNISDKVKTRIFR